MLYVKTKVLPSNIHGLGLFADQFIPKGTVVWKFTPGFDLKFTKEQILSFPEILQIYLYKYGWRSKKSKLYCLASDNGKYFNHSNYPNCLSRHTNSEDEVVTIAKKDIKNGEELTDDYSSFEYEKSKDDVLDYIAKKYKLDDELDPRFKTKKFAYKNRVHGYTSPYTEVRSSPIHELGLFAAKNIPKGTVVAAWGGRIVTAEEIKHLPKGFATNYALPIYPGFYIAETKAEELDSADFINHSCKPNCRIVNLLVMRTDRKIKSGEELTADFDVGAKLGRKILCKCGSSKCRKIVYF